MPSRRAQKAAAAIREVVSMAILAELNDPRIRDVTVTYVEVAGDLRRAKVHVSVMGDETKQQLSLRGLRNSAGFLQSKCARRLDTRYTPIIEFELDQGVKKSLEIGRILDDVLPRAEVPEEGGLREASSDDASEPGAGPSPTELTGPEDRPERPSQDPASS